jgi:hypothetical protein
LLRFLRKYFALNAVHRVSVVVVVPPQVDVEEEVHLSNTWDFAPRIDFDGLQ